MLETGEDPFIRTDDAPNSFSAWTYAQERAKELRPTQDK
jgi:hypothetical protein